nr:MAG TPA: Protein of unknown function (DUF2829) [Caudoviricetes sp.]
MNKEEMKQYTGTKTVKAMPMTMGEAYERKLLKEDVRPSECETDKAGYLVEYEAGYQSWSPAEPFEKAYKLSETFLDRLCIEYTELMERAEKCNDFLASNKVKELDRTSQALLSVQSGLMYQYGFVLGDRMDIVRKKKPVLYNFTFGTAVLLLEAGMAVRRGGWNGKGLFVVKQVPSRITADIIPNMQSLPQSAKDIIMARKEPHIDYSNQMLIINPDGRADSWVPSSSDVFAEDWELVTV